MISKSQVKQFIVVVLLAVFLIIAYSAMSINISRERSLENSVMDLRDTLDIYRLDGMWYFWDKELLEPDQITDEKLADNKRIYVPGNWNDREAFSDLPLGAGYGTYAIRLLVDPGSHIGIRIPSVFTDYKIYVNGQVLLQHGVVDSQATDSLPLIKTDLLYFMPRTKEMYLVIQVSNHLTISGGLINPIVIGELDKMIRYRSNALMQDIFIAGSVLLFVVYHLILYLLGRRDKSMLWLMIFSISIIILTSHLPNNEMIRTYLIESKLWLSVPKSVQLSLAFISASLIKLIDSLFREVIPKRIVKFLPKVALILSIIVIIVPMNRITLLFPFLILTLTISCLSVLHSLIKVVKEHRDGGLITLIGVAFIGFSILYDFHMNTRVINGYGIALIPIGFLAFLVLLSYVISLKYLKSFEALQISNATLKQNQMQLIQQGQLVSVGHLASGMAHEINNPLGYVKSNSAMTKDYLIELIEIYKKDLESYNGDEKLPEEIIDIEEELDDIYNDINNGIQRIQDIVNDLKTYSSVDSVDTYKEVNINDIVEVTSRLFKVNLDDRISLQVQLEELPFIHVFKSEIGQVLLNLLINAAEGVHEKYEENSGGQIVIKTHAINHEIIIEIIDNGIGIKEDNINMVFQPFYSSKDVGKGMGLGLSIAHEIISKHNGQLEVKSEYKHETIFTVKLPYMND